ncbi:MAG: O-antigen polymerase [Chloroflexi bacterium]|nr:O-antigen polymerase [Chloroflexota bacterium]
MISDQRTSVSKANTANGLSRHFSRRQSLLAALVSLLILVVCLAGLSLTAFADLVFNYGVSYGPQLDKVQNVTAGQLGATPVGVNVLLNHEKDPNSQVIDRTLDMVKDGGFGFIRQILPWEEVEAARGQYKWERFDILVDKARARGLQILLRLDRPPTWSRLQSMEGLSAEEKINKTGPPDNYADYYSFVGQVAARYKGKVQYYQVLNEPNLESEWNGRPVDPARYVELLKGAYQQIKAADPAAKVLSAPLAPTNDQTPNMNDLEYLGRMYAAGAKDYFDILSIQLYGLGYAPDFRYIQPDPQFKENPGSKEKTLIDLKRVNLNRPASIHEVMIKNGDGTKPAWAAEYGWVSVPADWPEAQKQTNWGKSVSEAEQARYLKEGIERVRREWPWVGVINVWFLRADPYLEEKPQDPTNYFSLVQPDFTPRPAYNVLKEYNTTRANIAYTGWHPASGDPALQDNGTTLRLTFQGERAEMVMKDATAPGNPTFDIKVKIDGQNERRLDYNTGPARLVLGEGLSDTTHVAEITGLDAGRIEGFFISRDNHFAWLIVLGLVVCGLGALVSGAFLFAGIGHSVAGLVPVAGRKAVKGAMFTRKNFWSGREKWAPWAMIGALLVFYYAPPVPLALLGALVFFLLCFIRPDWALGLALFTAPIYLHPRNLRPGGTLEFSLSEVIIVALAAAWLLRLAWQAFRQRQAERRFSLDLNPARAWYLVRRQGPFFLPLGLLFVLATVSLLAPLPAHLKEALREYRLVIVEPLVLFLLALSILGKKGAPAVMRLVDFLVAGGVMVALFGIFQLLFPLRPASTTELITASQTGCAIATEGVTRICSVYSHPDNLGLFLGRVIPLAACLPLFYSQAGWRIWKNPSWRFRLYSLSLVPMLICLVFSFSRGAWLGVGAAFLGMFVAVGSRRWLFAYGGLLLVGLAALPFIKVERITNLFVFGGSSSTRLYVWQSSVDIIKDHPLAGIGLDQFLYVYNPQYVNPLAWTERFTSHPHNLVLDFWLRLGILGPLLIGWLLFIFFKTALTRHWRKPVISGKPDSQFILRRALALGLFGSMLDFLVHGLVDNSFFVVDLSIIFCLSFAMLEILRREVTKPVSTAEDRSKENAA